MIYVGMVLYGYCDGYFGRDSYKNKRVEAFGVDWIVARDDSGGLCFADFKESGRSLTDQSTKEMVVGWTIDSDERMRRR